MRELRNIVIRLTAKHPGHGRSSKRPGSEAELDLAGRTAWIDRPTAAEIADSDMENAPVRRPVCRLQQPEPRSASTATAGRNRANYIEAALRLAHGNVSQAARLLGINRTTLYNRMESFAREQ